MKGRRKRVVLEMMQVASYHFTEFGAWTEGSTFHLGRLMMCVATLIGSLASVRWLERSRDDGARSGRKLPPKKQSPREFIVTLHPQRRSRSQAD